MRLSTLDFWGNRDDTDVDITAICEPLHQKSPVAKEKWIKRAFQVRDRLERRTIVHSNVTPHRLHHCLLMNLEFSFPLHLVQALSVDDKLGHKKQYLISCLRGEIPERELFLKLLDGRLREELRDHDNIFQVQQSGQDNTPGMKS